MLEELIRFREQMSTLFTFTFANREPMFTTYSLDGSTHRLTVLKVNILHQYKDNMRMHSDCLGRLAIASERIRLM